VKKTYLYLLVILFLFFLTRVYKIGEIPGSLYWDEASIGYNAYSLITTGKDEWGEVLPLHFRAFGEFKLPIYIYSVAVTELLFGLSEFSVRFPAVLYSLGILILTYLVSLKIFGNQKLSLLSTFILSVSPWFLIFSRTGYEATAGVMFYLLGIYFFLLSFKNHPFIIFTFISFVLSMYSYNSFRVIVPLTVIFLAILSLKQSLLKSKKYFSTAFLGIIIFFILSVPIVRLMSSEDGNTRVQAVGIFHDNLSLEEVVETFFKNYLSHFSLDFLVIQGDKNMRSHYPGVGQLYIIDLPLILLGFSFLVFYIYRYKALENIKEHVLAKSLLLMVLPIFVVLVGLIPSAITKEAPHSLRSLVVAPFLSILVAGSIVFLETKIKIRLFTYIIVGIYLSFFALYYSNFIKNYNFMSSADWQFGYQKIFKNYNQEFNKFDNIIISDEYAQPYIFALFYLHYNPSLFRSEVQYNGVDRWGLSMVARFNKFSFQQPSFDKIPVGRSLVFASSKEKIATLMPSDQINNLDGSVAFYVYEVKK